MVAIYRCVILTKLRVEGGGLREHKSSQWSVASWCSLAGHWLQSVRRQCIMSGFVSRGFKGRRREPEVAGRLPPGQYLTRDFPVLSAGPTPRTPLDRWDFSITGEVDQPRRWTWERVPGPAARDAHRRHPLRDQVVQARHASGRASRSTRCWRASTTTAALRDRLLRRRLHDQPAARGCDRRQGLGRVRVRRRAARARARRTGPAAGAAPLFLEERQVGARACELSARGRARLLGIGSATTTTATHGGNSGTRSD